MNKFKMDDNAEEIQIKLARKYLKLKIVEDNVTFRGHTAERNHIYDLVQRTIKNGESHSAIIIGPRGSGKTTLINCVLSELSQQLDLLNDGLIIRLNGLLHHDDKIALKAITKQMELENVVGDRVFGSFSENLSYLLSCLKSGNDRQCRSMVFILEDFDMFCHTSSSQTLLYNLFDITHSKQSPICVLGMTCRLDVIELLEKRVKSRFSHRHIFIFPGEDTNEQFKESNTKNQTSLDRVQSLFVDLLSLPLNITPKKINKSISNNRMSELNKDTFKRKRSQSRSSESSMYSDDTDIIIQKLKPCKNTKKASKNYEEIINTVEKSSANNNLKVPSEILEKCNVSCEEFCLLDPVFVTFWNEHIQFLSREDKVLDALDKYVYFNSNEQPFRDILFQVICRLSSCHPQIEVSDVTDIIDGCVSADQRVRHLQSLSILELSLVIAMKHQLEIFDGQPMNFEMVLHRYTKFANSNSSSQTVPRAVVLKAFEHLKALEVIVPAAKTSESCAAGRMQEYQLYTLAVCGDDVVQAVKGFKALPTEINHWLHSSIV